MPSSLHNPDYQIFRSLLIKERELSGLTQVQLAEKLGKPQSYVSKYERGERRVDFAELVRLADAMGFEVCGFVEKYRAALVLVKFKATGLRNKGS